jgi:hypothetical protein
VTSNSIASGEVVRSINGLTDLVTLAAGSNVTITPSGNTLQIAAVAGTNAVASWGLTGNSNTLAGVNVLGTTDNQPLDLAVNNQRALRLQPAIHSPNVIGGFGGNYVGSNVVGATIGGGGMPHIAPFPFSLPNVVNGSYGSILGGYGNTVNGYAATVAGGQYNSAEGGYSFAVGRDAHALHDGTFVWADSTSGGASSSADNQFVVRAGGGVKLVNGTELGWGSDSQSRLSSDQGGSIELGDSLNGGAPYIDFHLKMQQAEDYNVRLINDGVGRLSCYGLFAAQTLLVTSDREAKKDFMPVDTKKILERLVTVPIRTWTFRTGPNARHLGPVAQDFQAAFGVGSDEKHIATVDADGVAMAAIQGLYRIVQEKNAEINDLRSRILALERAINSAGQSSAVHATRPQPER